MGKFGIWELVIILVIVIALFGTARLKNIGSDLGSALKGFKKSMAEDSDEKPSDADQAQENLANKENVASNTDTHTENKDKV